MKTIFITSPHADEIASASLIEYGEVYPVGVEQFADICSTTTVGANLSSFSYSWLSKYDSVDPAKPGDKDALDLITLGVVKPTAISFELAERRRLYAFRRSILEEILIEINRGRRWFLLHSDLGNGKSIVKHQLSAMLAGLNYQIFWDTNFDLNRARDIRQIKRETGNIVIFIDETHDRFEVIENLLGLNLPNIIVFINVRTTAYELGMGRYEENLPSDYIAMDINRLRDVDAEAMVDLLDNIGLWGEKAHLGRDEKCNFVKTDCQGRLSRLIISIYENSEIGARLVESAKAVMKGSPDVASLAILSFLISRSGHTPSATLTSEILNRDVWKLVRSAAFVQAGEFIRFQGDMIASRSSLISTFLLRNAFLPELILQLAESFVRRLAGIRRNSALHNIFTELQRFPFIETIVISDRKRDLIIGYFQALSDLPDCKKNGLFWLHYAMARLSFNEFKEATHYFEHARSLAKDNPKILMDVSNHFARLLIDSRIKSPEYADHFEAFTLAHEILIRQINLGSNRHFPFRQARKYVDFISSRKELLSRSQTQSFVLSCQQILSAISYLDGPIARSNEVIACTEALGRAIQIARRK